MSIPAISAIGAGVTPVTPTSYLSAPNGLSGTGLSGVANASGASSALGVTGGAPVPSTGFDSALNAVDQLQQMQSNTDSLAVQAVDGSLTDVHDYTIAAAQSQLTMDLTSAVRNQAVSAFNTIMGMQA